MIPRNSRRAFACALLASTALTTAATAQQVPTAEPFRQVDANGVDLTWGDLVLTFPEGSIGFGLAKLDLIRTNMTSSANQWDQYTFHRDVSGGIATIRVGLPGGTYDLFTSSASGFTAGKANGGSLTGSNSNYIYTAPDGTTVRFVDLSNSWEIGQASNFCSTLTSTTSCDLAPNLIKMPNGGRITLAWDVHQVSSSFYDYRLDAVSSNYGYSITFRYQTDTWVSPGGTWHIRAGADFRNTAISTAVQSSVNYAYPLANTVDLTDTAGNIWRLTGTSIQRPGESSPYFSATLDTNGYVTSVANNGVTTNYNHSVAGSTVTETVTDPLSNHLIVTSDLTIGRPTSSKDPLNRTTTYGHDTSGRLTQITQPEGNYVQYTLDARGNATQTTYVAKSGSGLANITTSAVYPTTCTVAVTCNEPTSTTDAGGNTTAYTYDSNHGGVLTITRPAPSSGGVQPQTRYTYTQFGTSPQQYWLPTGISECQTLAGANGSTPAACAGGADEVTAILRYDANANLTSIAKGNGAGTLTATAAMAYDALGNMLTVDGPLSGPGDTTRYRYDAARRVTGIISPDPDGSGSLPNRAIRRTYRSDGQVSKKELGTVPSQADADWSGFAPSEWIDVTYDGNARQTQAQLSGKDALGATAAYALTQTSYDALGRTDCQAVRMTISAYGSLPSSACTQGTAGSDRISQTIYDARGNVSQNVEGVGTGDPTIERTLKYSDNGKLVSLLDADANLTTYVYDGFDRLSQTVYPLPTQGAGASNGNDYQALAYDNRGNVVTVQQRDGSHISYTYDNLSRATQKSLPGTEPAVTYAYDNLGRLTSASQTGNALSFSYDALGRELTETGPQGTVTSEYDLAGERTKITYPGTGLYVNYDYLPTGDLATVRENGATSGAGVLASYYFDNLGRHTSVVFGNGTSTTYAYDAISRLSSLTDDFAGTTNDLTINSIGYNPASQITGLTRSNTAYSLPIASAATTSSADGLNRLSKVNLQNVGYDTKGNLVSDPTTAKTYGYSSENLLTSASGGVTLSYDPMLRLYDVKGASSETRFAYDGANAIAEYDGLNTLKYRYVFGPGVDAPIVQYDSSGNRSWLHADERGSIIANSDGSANASTPNTYDEYGVPASNNAGRFQYTGQMWIPELGLYYYKARFYAPHLGRFIQTDPIAYEDSPNLYSYVGGDPVNLLDPQGTCPVNETVTTFYDTNGNGRVDPGEHVVSVVSHVVDDGSGREQCGVGGTGDSIFVTGTRRPKPKQKSTWADAVAHDILCRIKSVNFGGDFAGGFGPVIRGGAGVSYNTRTGLVSWQYNWGAGYGAAFNLGLAGSLSNSVPSAGHTSTWNFGANIIAGLSAQFQSPKNASVALGAGPKVGFEISNTDNYTKTGSIYITTPIKC